MTLLWFAAARWAPFVVLGVGAAACLTFFFRFVQAQLFAGRTEDQIALLHGYREEGVVPGGATADYLTLTRLLGAISPAVAMHQEPWVGCYYGLIRALGYVAFRRWAERQMTRLAAHQANRYHTAVQLLAELRADA
ncbi:MAG: hypothetical protein ACRD2E_11865 [Terriglobales bacterium]